MRPFSIMTVQAQPSRNSRDLSHETLQQRNLLGRALGSIYIYPTAYVGFRLINPLDDEKPATCSRYINPTYLLSYTLLIEYFSVEPSLPGIWRLKFSPSGPYPTWLLALSSDESSAGKYWGFTVFIYTLGTRSRPPPLIGGDSRRALDGKYSTYRGFSVLS